jgi:hypothetical protein
MTRASAKKTALDAVEKARWGGYGSLTRMLVSVQPMNEPSGEIYYLDFFYNSRWSRLKRWLRNLLRTARRRQVCRHCCTL